MWLVYSQETVSRDLVPVLVMKLIQTLDIPNSVVKEKYKFPPPSSAITTNYISSWDIPDKFQIHLSSIEKLNCDVTRTDGVSTFPRPS